MRKTKIALLLFIVMITGIVVVTLWLNLAEKRASGKEETPPPPTPEGAKMVLEKIRLVEDKQGRTTWELEAASVQQFEDQNILVLEDVKVTVHTKDGRTFVLSGRKGKVDQTTKDAELSGDVVLLSHDGYRLKTQSVTYRHEVKRVMSSDPVEIEGAQLHVVGTGMLVDMNARTFRILSGVKTQWRGGKTG